MNFEFANINKNEILKYLQYRGSGIPKDIDDLINQAIGELKKTAKVKYKYIEVGKDFEGWQEILIGKDIGSLLETSDRLILLALTLGNEIEMAIRRYSYSNLAYSVILDTTASAGVESLANDINIELADQYKPYHLTDRFSPGYGDLPIIVQKNFLALLNGEKDLGIKTSQSGIMIPRKSITAIIGISDIPQAHRKRGCENCRLYLECEFVRRGETCGYEK